MRQVLLLLGLLACFTASAFSAPSLSELAADPGWRALLHYPQASGSSYVDDPRFFLAERGATDPLAELQASVTEIGRRGDTVCRFPDRYLWLNERGLAAPGQLQRCEQYRQWRDKLDLEKIVLVFASSYLNSPSSMYGHTFLRLDPAGERASSAFLSFALNFGAAIPPGENGPLYAYRGLLGGYPGLFTMQPYYEKIQEYTRLENRDMWEYRLNLTAAEIDRLLAHTWALRNINFDYYFFDENCSFRLLELLEVARPGVDLTSPFDLAAMPVDTVRQVVDAGLVAQVQFRPSKYREFATLTEGLPEDQLQWIARLTEAPEQRLSADFERMAPEAQANIVLAAYRLLRYRQNEQRRDSDVAKRSLALLRGVKETAAARTPPLVAMPLRPDRGHETSTAALAVGLAENRQFIDALYRISYHDGLDALGGYPDGASLTMGEVALRWQDREGIKLQRFVPVAIRSLAIRDDFFSPLSWQVGAGVERLPSSPDQSLTTFLDGGAGGSWAGWGGQYYILASARLEYQPDAERNWRLGPGLRAGQLWQGDRFSAEIFSEVFHFDDGESRSSAGVAANWQLSRNQALRLSAVYQDGLRGSSAEFSLSWRSYL